MITIIMTLLVHINQFHKYSIFFLSISTYLSHISSLFFMGVLVHMFVKWYRSKKNSVVLLYMLSFALISVNIVIAMLYLEYQYSSSLTYERKPYPIHIYIVRQEVTILSQFIEKISDGLYFSSFICIWAATLLLLRQYQYKIGKIRYIGLVCLPLLYYLFPLEGFFRNVFSPLIVISPITFGVLYVLLFSATKQVGALFFSLSFLAASSLIGNKSARTFVLISAIGIAIIFGSIEITTLQYRLYPPFGLITQAFMLLGSYLLSIGILTSSRYISNDANLRKDIYKNAQSQLSLLKTIGVTQMQEEVMRKIKSAEIRTNYLGADDHSRVEEEDVRKIVNEVLDEVYSKTKDDKIRSKRQE